MSSSWSAISRGAVIHGMTKLKLDTPFSVGVRSRISRASFGAICEEEWDDDRHYPEDKIFDPILQRDVAIRIMKWHVLLVRRTRISMKIRHFLTSMFPELQGQDVYVDCHPSFKFTKFLSKPQEKIETAIYMSRAEEPPARQDDSVKEIFKLTWNIQVDWESLPLFVNDQQETFRKLEFTVEMKCSGGTTVFSIYHAGYKQASKNVDLEIYETGSNFLN